MSGADRFETVPFLGKTYSMPVYGPMSQRQYSAAREDALVEAILARGWERLGYVGASYGLQAIRLSEAGPVVAMEPIKCIYHALCEAVRLNKAKSVLPLRRGLAEHEGERIIGHGGHWGATPSFAPAGGGPFEERVRLLSFKAALFQTLDVLVVDIEGYEYEVFVKGPPVPARIATLFIEIHPQFLSDSCGEADIYNSLRQQGFNRTLLDQRGGQVHYRFDR